MWSAVTSSASVVRGEILSARLRGLFESEQPQDVSVTTIVEWAGGRNGADVVRRWVLHVGLTCEF